MFAEIRWCCSASDPLNVDVERTFDGLIARRARIDPEVVEVDKILTGRIGRNLVTSATNVEVEAIAPLTL